MRSTVILHCFLRDTNGALVCARDAEATGAHGRLLLVVQRRSAGVCSQRARSHVNAGVVWCPGWHPLIGHFIGRVLRDTCAGRRPKDVDLQVECPRGVPLTERNVADVTRETELDVGYSALRG